jgi:hypothetical protein
VTRVVLIAALVLAACGSSGGGTGGDGGGNNGALDGGTGGPTGDAGPRPDGGPDPTDDELSTASGCAGVYNPDQVLDLHFTMSEDDWSALKADTTNDVYFSTTFHCNNDAPLPFPVAIRRKRSGSIDKPGLKVDFNELAPGSDWQSLKKLSLENGISEGSGDAEMRDVVSEYLSWRFFVLSGAMAGRAVFARVFVNGSYIGTYVNVEQVDKRFLRSRLGDDTGWLYKKSGSPDDGYKTNETLPNPYEADLCFWDNNPCAAPSDAQLETYLPMHLDVDQMLIFGGVNALIANADAPIVKDNNFYWYDYAAGPRVYFPWDLDTAMKESPALFGGPGTTIYTDVLLTHWEDDYDVLLTNLIEGPLTIEAISAELDRAVAVAGGALEADPLLGGGAADAADDLEAWWASRHAQVAAELAAHAP